MAVVEKEENNEKEKGIIMESSFAIVSEQGYCSYMEDRHFLKLDFGEKGVIFGGVYDGHYGEKAAEYAAQHIHERFLDFLSGIDPTKAFIAAYQAISDEISKEWGGTCAANFFIRNGEIFFANAGDARIIVVGKSEQQLTIDHRLDVEIERQRIKKMGGEIYGHYVYRGHSGLMVTRSLGDQYFKEVGIIATPCVGSYKILPTDKFLIAASDCLFDSMNNCEVGELARTEAKPEEVARALKEEVLFKHRGDDNLTIIVLKLNDT